VPLLPLLTAASVAAAFGPCTAPFGSPQSGAMAALSLSGSPGLLEVPAAVELPQGDLVMAYNNAPIARHPVPLEWQNNVFFGVGFLPRVSLVGRFAVRHTGDPVRDLDGRDKSANAQLLVSREHGWWPAIAVGAQDVSGANAMYEARYITATRTVGARARLTAGYGTGRALLNGAFGGVELAPCSWVALLAEHDGYRANVGLRLHPFPQRAAGAGLLPSLSAGWRGDAFTGAVGLRLALGPDRTHRPLPPPVRTETEVIGWGPAPETATGALALAVRDALVHLGLENVRVALQGDTLLDLHYENRRFPLDDLEALGAALGTVAARAPASITTVRATMRKVDLPVLTVETGLPAFRRYLADPAGGAAFVAQLRTATPDRAAREPAAPPANRTRGRLDLTVHPRMEMVINSEVGAFETRLAAIPEATMQLGRGTQISARRALLVHESERFLRTQPFGDDQLLLHQGIRLPAWTAPRGALGIAQLSVGRLGVGQVGGHWEQEVILAGGRWSLGGTIAAYGEHVGQVDRSYAFGTVRWRRPESELRTALSLGRFRYGDVGGVVEVGRRFGVVETSFLLRASDLSSWAGIRLGIPLAPRRELRPSIVRLRAPGFYEQEHGATVFEPIPFLRRDVARALPLGFDLGRGYTGRDWLREGTVTARAWAIRNAALRWSR
jgi:hypothetical protein